MAAVNGPCPGTAEIERLAGGEDASPEAALHVASCPECLRRLETAKDEARFVARVRALAGTSLPPDGAPRIHGYRTLSIISSGSQGIVFRAVQESTQRAVAIKILSVGPAASVRQRARAEREAEIAARLRHPNIVSVYESRGLSDGRIAVVMEYVDGVPIDAWKPPGVTAGEMQREVLRVFIDVCNAIHHAHLNGVIHRDVKPDNILVTNDGRPVVLDFGIAKAGGLHATMTGEFAGTPAYASPEQVSGKPDDVDGLTDVYSLGVILYRLLCGTMPYEVGGSLLEIARAISEVEPTPPRRVNQLVDADLEAVMLRALAKEKSRRYRSAASLARDLERYIAGDPVEARSGSGWYLLRKAVLVNRRRLTVAVLAAAMLALAAGTVVYSLASAAREREQAHAESVRARAVAELLREALPNADPSRPELERIIGAGLGRLYYRLETGAYADDPEMDQALRRMWGRVYTGLGSGKAAGWVEYAEVSLRNGLVRLRMEHGEEHPEIADTMHELAAVLLVRKRPVEAEAYARRALSMRRKLVGPESIPAADTSALLARILETVGNDEEAVREVDVARRVYRSQAAPGNDIKIANLDMLRSRALLRAGDTEAATRSLRDALIVLLRRLPPEDPDLLRALDDAATLVQQAPESAFAVALARAWETSPDGVPDAIRQDLPVLAKPDPLVSEEFRSTGRTAAIGHLLALHEILIGHEDRTAVGLLIARMRAAEAEKLPAIRGESAVRAAEILSKSIGPNDFAVLVFLDYATTVFCYAGRTEDAVGVARRSCAFWDSIPARARDNLLAANSRRRLGWALALTGMYEEAEAAYRASYQEFSSAVGTEHYATALAESGLALCLAQRSALEEADRRSAHALSVLQRPPTPAGDQVGHIMLARGHVLRMMGRYDQARAIHQDAWNLLFRLAEPIYPFRRLLINDLVACCEATGDMEQADAWRRRLEEPAPSELLR